MSDLPNGWEQSILSNLISFDGIFSDGDWVESKDQDPKGSIRLLQLADIGDGIFLDKSKRFINEIKFEELRCTELFENDILVARMPSPLGRACLMPRHPQRCITVVDVAVIRLGKHSMSSRWLKHFLNSPVIRAKIDMLSSGTTRQRISRKDLGQINIHVPPLKEQERIADKLDLLLARVDACRDRLNKIPLIIKNFRCAVLNAAISGELTNDWRLERNQSLDSWKQCNGRDVFPFITSGSRGWSSYYSTQGALFLRVGNLNHFTTDLDLNRIQYVNPPVNAEGKRTRIEVGDILISITADVGMVAFISEDIGEAYINQHLCLARQTGEYLGSYLAYFIASPLGGIGQLTQMQRGATKAGLALNDIRSVKFLLPDLDEQHEIVSRIESLFAYADYFETNYQSAFKSLEQLTPVILDKAFRGELVPQDPNDEPASILLECIRAERIANLTTQKITIRRPKMSKMSSEAVKKEIFDLPNDKFSFNELHDHLHKQLLGDYDTLKEILFTLLDEEPESGIAQIFDSEVEEMCFTRRQK